MFAANGMVEGSENNDSGHFRISFSNGEVSVSYLMHPEPCANDLIPKFADLKKAVTIFGRVIREFFQEGDL